MLSSKSSLTAFALVLLLLVGCTASKTDRGYLFRHESAWEVNRTPWIGCPPDSNCDGQGGFFDCLKKDNGDGKSCKKFRRHCGVTTDCTARNPCCKTLGCGMWVDPCEPMSTGSPARACGLTPFCSPMKPCGLTPYCGKHAAMVPNTLMLGNSTVMNGGIIPNTMVLPSSTPNIPSNIPQPTLVPPGSPAPAKAPAIAGPNGMRIGAVPARPIPGGTLVSMGIVPGVSTITTGGLVAAAGVATPAGVMTPNGVMLPNGTLQSQGVIRVCMANPNCSAARPCGLTAGCGMIVPVTIVSNNAVMLASALTAPGVAGNVMPAYGNMAAYGNMPGYVNGNVMSAGGIPADRAGTGMLVNPITGQPVSGLTMNGTAQLGYPPIGYTPTGYSPGYPRPVPPTTTNEEDEEQTAVAPQPPQSRMPAPRFHPVPTKPVFQRSEGLPTTPSNKRTASGKVLTRESLNAAMEQAYLEGIADAMQDVQDEIDAQNREIAKAELQAKIERQAVQIQAHLDARQQEVLQTQYHQAQPSQAQLRQVSFQSPQFQQSPHPVGPGSAYPVYPSQKFDGNLLASTKAAGSGLAAKVSDIFAPLGELFGTGQPKSQTPPQYHHPARNPSFVGISQPTQVTAVPVRAKPSQRVENPIALCPPRPQNNISPSSPVALVSDPAPSADVDLVPPRPTTAAKKPKKVVEVDDDSEPNMVQTANFTARGT